MQIQSLETGCIYEALDFNGREFLIVNNNGEAHWWETSKFKMYHGEKDDFDTALYRELYLLCEKKTEYEFILGDLEETYIGCELKIEIKNASKIINSYPLDKDTIKGLIEYYQNSLEEINKEIKKFKLSKCEVNQNDIKMPK